MMPEGGSRADRCQSSRAARSVDYVEIDSGHWPMFTRPTELAALLHAISVR